jgi:uncharacterized protein YndB with AHSA1/START domain
MLKTLLIILLLVATVLILAATKPNTFRVQRSVSIQASPEKIFALIDNLHSWPQWAPQDRDDPRMKRTFSGPESGVGATSNWSGSGNTGTGQMTITESEPSKKIAIAVDWQKPFQARNINEFVLDPEGGSTRVTWTMQGPNLYMMKLMGVFTNMDRLMGKHFENGLANLKAVAEK